MKLCFWNFRTHWGNSSIVTTLCDAKQIKWTRGKKNRMNSFCFANAIKIPTSIFKTDYFFVLFSVQSFVRYTQASSRCSSGKGYIVSILKVFFVFFFLKNWNCFNEKCNCIFQVFFCVCLLSCRCDFFRLFYHLYNL